MIRSYKPSRLVLGADNDDGNENAEDTLRKSFEKLKSELPGVKCRLVKPELQGLEGKCDWNDMLKLSGPEDVIRQFDLLQTVDKKNI